MAISSIQLFWCILAFWSLIGCLVWMFHSGRKLLLRAKNPFQLVYRALWFGPLVTSLAVIYLIDKLLGKISFWAETKEESDRDEEEAKNVKDLE